MPVVVISSRSGAKHVEHALRMGANEYLTKPFTAEDLGRTIARWVHEADASGPDKGGN